MHLPLILMLALMQVPDAPVAKPQSRSTASAAGSLELQGDKLGESLETFHSQHPKALCDESQKPRATCYQWTDVSIFGVSANAGPTCSLRKRYAADCLQGIVAKFTESGLISLVYTVAGTDRTEITAALKKKLGSPTRESSDGSTWNTDNGTASVTIGKASDSPNDPTLITVTISSSY